MMQTISATQEFYRTCIVAVGMFLNCIVILVVTSSQQLRYPRHVFWAAISFFECLFLVQCALELAVIVNHDHLACQVFVLLCTVDYSVLLLCILLGRFRSLLVHRPLRMVQEKCHRSQCYRVNYDDIGVDVADCNHSILDGLSIHLYLHGKFDSLALRSCLGLVFGHCLCRSPFQDFR